MLQPSFYKLNPERAGPNFFIPLSHMEMVAYDFNLCIRMLSFVVSIKDLLGHCLSKVTIGVGGMLPIFPASENISLQNSLSVRQICLLCFPPALCLTWEYLHIERLEGSTQFSKANITQVLFMGYTLHSCNTECGGAAPNGIQIMY